MYIIRFLVRSVIIILAMVAGGLQQNHQLILAFLLSFSAYALMDIWYLLKRK